jgi:glutamate carboxypeptidase
VSGARLRALRARGREMVAALAALVEIESPSSDPAGIAACARELAALAHALLGSEPEWLEVSGRTHLRWRHGEPTRVLLLGHLDTVWPLGTTAAWPFSADARQATGPGAFDMKAGLVQGLYALASLDDLDGVTLLVTSDEEVGSPTSRELIEREAKGALAALVLEPSAGPAGALKVARKGVATYEVEVRGRAAHAGLEPEKGVNALVELAHQVLALERLGRPELGTTVTPTLAAAGTTQNTVPAAARFHVDVRAFTPEEQERVDRELKLLEPLVPGAGLAVHGEPNRPPLPAGASAELFAVASRLAEELGLPGLEPAEVGGGSDGNLTAGIGVRTLDGLGAVGGNAHALGEHVVLAAMPERAALVASLVEALRPAAPQGRTGELRGAWDGPGESGASG